MGELEEEFKKLLTDYLGRLKENIEIGTEILKFRNDLNKLIDTYTDKDIYILNTDGASVGNPGPSQIGIICKAPDGADVFRISKHIGVATNNDAEYLAIIEGLKECLDRNIKKVLLLSDSELVVKQLNNEYKVKNKKLFEKYNKAQEIISKFDKIIIKHISRKYNKDADLLSKVGLE